MSTFEDLSNVQQDVFYRGIDQNIYFRYFNSAQGWQVQNVTALSGAPLAGALTAVSSFKDVLQNQQHVVFEGSNGHIYQAYSNSSPASWNFQDVTTLTGGSTAAAASPIFSYCDNSADVQYIFYLGQNGDVNVLYWHGNWAGGDASSVAQAVPAATGSSLTGFVDTRSSTAHVFYEGSDQHIHELYSDLSPTGILAADVTVASGATSAAVGSSLTGYFDSSILRENIFFQGTNQHIYHAFFSFSVNRWQTEDLTAVGNGPAAAAQTSLSSFGDVVGNQQHVFYVGTDQHLHQFFYSGAWYPDDVTADLGAPLAAPTSPLASFKDDPDNQQHAFYLGADGHFYHVWYSSGWNIQDLTSGYTVPAI